MGYLPWAECWDLRHYYRKGEGRMAGKTFQEEFTRDGTQAIKGADGGQLSQNGLRRLIGHGDGIL